MSGDKISWVRVGALKFSSITFSSPAPKDAQTKIWGYIPNIEPKKKLFTLTLKIVGKMFEIKNGIPPTNL